MLDYLLSSTSGSGPNAIDCARLTSPYDMVTDFRLLLEAICKPVDLCYYSITIVEELIGLYCKKMASR